MSKFPSVKRQKISASASPPGKKSPSFLAWTSSFTRKAKHKSAPPAQGSCETGLRMPAILGQEESPSSSGEETVREVIREKTCSSSSQAAAVRLIDVQTVAGGGGSFTEVQTFRVDMPPIFECPVCCCEVPDQEVVTISPCCHQFCSGCVVSYLRTAEGAGQLWAECPGCAAPLDPRLLASLCPPDMMLRWERRQVAHGLVREPGCSWCPACNVPVLVEDWQSCTMPLVITCPQCAGLWCFSCGLPLLQSALRVTPHKCASQNSLADMLKARDGDGRRQFRVCPKCSVMIERTVGCNEVRCRNCRVVFCWLCGKDVSLNSSHFVNPASGCSYFSRRRVGRGRRALRQMCIYLGTPAAISVLAAPAALAVLVGLPVIAAAHLHTVLPSGEGVNSHWRRARLLAGTLAALVLAPAASALCVAAGTTLALLAAYVYMPMSAAGVDLLDITANALEGAEEEEGEEGENHQSENEQSLQQRIQEIERAYQELKNQNELITKEMKGFSVPHRVAFAPSTEGDTLTQTSIGVTSSATQVVPFPEVPPTGGGVSGPPSVAPSRPGTPAAAPRWSLAAGYRSLRAARERSAARAKNS